MSLFLISKNLVIHHIVVRHKINTIIKPPNIHSHNNNVLKNTLQMNIYYIKLTETKLSKDFGKIACYKVIVHTNYY